MKIISLFLLILLLWPVHSYSEGSYKVLKLKDDLEKARDGSDKIPILIDIANELKGFHPDSGYIYLNNARNFLPEIRSVKLKDEFLIRIQLVEAAIEIAEGNFEKAFQLDSLALAKARELKNKALEAHALMTLGSYFFNQSDFHTADSLNQLALAAVRQSDDRKLEGKILTNMGVTQFIFGNTELADSLFRAPLQIAENIGDQDLTAASLLNIGLLNMYKGEMSTAIEYVNQSAEIYLSIEGMDGLVLCYQNLTSIYYNLADYGNAIYYNKLNFDLSAQINDRIGMAKAMHNMGEAYLHIGDYETAMSSFLQSIELKRQLNHLQGVAVSSRSLGNLLFQQGEHAKALRYYQESYRINKETGDMINMAISFSDLGNVMLELNMIDSALHYLMNAREIFERNGLNNSMADVYLQISKAHYNQYDLKRAKMYCDLAEETDQNIGDQAGLINAWMMQSAIGIEEAKIAGLETATGKKMLDEARQYALKAMEPAISKELLPAQAEIASRLMNIYQYLGNTADALKYATMRFGIMDTLARIQRAEALANAEIRFETQQKQEKIDRLESEKTLQDEIIQKQSLLTARLNLLLISLGGMVLLIISTSILFIKNKEKKKDILQEKYKNEITLLKMQNINNRLSPHLFFNLLGNVGGNMHQPELFKENLSNISVLLRKSLENSEKHAIPLADELDLVRSYVSLQKSQLPDFFKADFNVAETVDLQKHIPSMMVQIPVENAIKHGLMPKEGNRELKVEITKNNGSLNITIEDNGVGRNASNARTTGTGTGLKVLLQTIHLINQNNREKVEFSIRDGHKEGTIVEIKIPDSCIFSW